MVPRKQSGARNFSAVLLDVDSASTVNLQPVERGLERDAVTGGLHRETCPNTGTVVNISGGICTFVAEFLAII